MTTEELLERPLFSLTVSEFLQVQKMAERPTTINYQPAKQAKIYVHGIDGIASLFNCSRKTAQIIKNSGRIDRAVTQIGRKITVDAELALQLNTTKK